MSAAAARRVAVGDVLASGPSAAAPNGFLRKVLTKVGSGGEVTLRTRDATLPEAVPVGEIHAEVERGGPQRASSMSSSSLRSMELGSHAQGTLLHARIDAASGLGSVLDSTCGLKRSVKLTASVDADVGYNLDASWRPFRGTKVRFTVDIYTGLGYGVTGEFGVSCKVEREFPRIRYTPIIVFAGPVPVVLVPTLAATGSVEVTGSFNGSYGTRRESWVTAGFEYEDGRFNPISSNQQRQSSVVPTFANHQGKIEVSFGPDAAILFYGVTGPGVAIKGFAEAGIEPAGTPWWWIDVGIKAQMEGSVDLLGIERRLSITILELRRRLIDSGDAAPSGPPGSGAGTNPPPLTSVGPRLASGTYHACAIRRDATVVCWGDNGYGALGDGTQTERLSPTAVPGLEGVKAIAAGYFRTCALRGDGTVVCWGLITPGEGGEGGQPAVPPTFALSPTVAPGLAGVTAITGNADHMCALKNTGMVACWGQNYRGQLGDGTTTDRLSPTAVPGLSDVKAITAGSDHTCALRTDGTIACWGWNEDGQLGDGTTTSRLSPTAVPGLSGVKAISAHYAETCALTSDATALCWGNNDFGQLGDGTKTERLSPTSVSGLSGVDAISVGFLHTCALRSDTTVACWGNNLDGELGDGTTTGRASPTTVPGLTGIVAILGGDSETFAVRSDGTVACWGDNRFGQLGDGTKTRRLSPIVIPGLVL